MSESSRRQTKHGRRQRGLIISLVVVVAVSLGSLAATLGAKWSPRLGLDLAGGLSVIYTPAHQTSQADLNETVTVLSNRVNGLGVSGAQVNTQGQNVVVQVPGIKNGNSVLKTIGQTAQLYFRPLLCTAPLFAGKHSPGAMPASAPLPATCPAANEQTSTNLGVNSAGAATNAVAPDAALQAYPSTAPANDLPNQTVLLPALAGSGQNGVRYLLGPEQLTGHVVKTAFAQQNQSGAWVVSYTIVGDQSAHFDQVAARNFHQILAVELDGVVESAPIMDSTSFGGQAQITGGNPGFTATQAQTLAQAMQFGALPVRLNLQQSLTVSPTLGKASLKAGLAAGLVGLALVLLYTIFYYRLLGVVVVSGLAVTAGLLWAIISALGHTSIAPSFSLAGVTGLIVSIGITVDSYIVYFERLKDETRAGRSIRTSVDRGFAGAFRTVLAADLVSLAAAVILFLVATGDVQGFAFFLGLSTILDIVVTYYFTRPLVVLLGRNERFANSGVMGIARGLAITPVDGAERELGGVAG